MKYVLCLLMLGAVRVSLAQNLVPNPSFEDTLYCPQNLFSAGALSDWRFCRSTPDFFHRCSETFSDVAIPTNILGYQEPFTGGNGYAGIHTYTGSDNYREILGCQLTSPLTIGTNYAVSFRASLGNNSGVASNNFGVRFTNAFYLEDSTATPSPLFNTAHVYEPGFITDTTGWVLVSGIFVADSAYTQLMIGNFFDDSQTAALTVGVGANAYYYIDNVCVAVASRSCETNTSTNHQPVQSKLSVYPTIGQQIVTITFPQRSTHFTIFNAIGQSVYNSNVTAFHQAVDVSRFSEGIYFVRVQTHQGVQTVRFFVQ